MVEGDTVQLYRNFMLLQKEGSQLGKKEDPTMVQEYDPEPERYYDWMLWKLRQERKMEQDDPMDDITKDGQLSAWTEKPHLSKEDLFMRDIAEMKHKTKVNDSYQRTS